MTTKTKNTTVKAWIIVDKKDEYPHMAFWSRNSARYSKSNSQKVLPCTITYRVKVKISSK